MDFLDDLLKKTSPSNDDIDRMLEERYRDLVKSHKRRVEDDDEEELEEEEEEKSRKAKKGKKDIKEFLGDDDDEGIDEEEEAADEEPRDYADEEAEEEAAEREKKILRRKARSKKLRTREREDIQDAIDEDEGAYFDDEDDGDFSEEEFDIPEEQGDEEGIITNYGRRVKGKAKKSLNDDAFMDIDFIDFLGDIAMLLEATLKEQNKIKKAVAVLVKSQQKFNSDMELIKSQTPIYPMPPLMYKPTIQEKKNNQPKYSQEQVREALMKGMYSGQVNADLVRDFEVFVQRPNASVDEWVNDMLDEPVKKALGL